MLPRCAWASRERRSCLKHLSQNVSGTGRFAHLLPFVRFENRVRAGVIRVTPWKYLFHLEHRSATMRDVGFRPVFNRLIFFTPVRLSWIPISEVLLGEQPHSEGGAVGPGAGDFA